MPTHLLKPNIDLVRDSGMKKENEFTKKFENWSKRYKIDTPYVFRHDNKLLCYIGANHTTNIKSKTFSNIRYVHDTIDFDLVIIEGLPYEYGMNDEEIVNEYKQEKYTDEVSHNVTIADEKRIDWTGVEPTDNQLLQFLMKKDFNKSDIIGFLYLQMIPECRRSHENKTKCLHNVAEFIHDTYGIDDFDLYKWYSDNYNDKFNYEKITNGTTAPVKNGTIVQQISHASDILRNELMVIYLFKLINRKKYSKILIVYGYNHFYSIFPVIKDIFGDPVMIDVNQ